MQIVVTSLESKRRFIVQLSGHETIGDIRAILVDNFNLSNHLLLRYGETTLSEPSQRVAKLPKFENMCEFEVSFAEIAAPAEMQKKAPQRDSTKADIKQLMELGCASEQEAIELLALVKNDVPAAIELLVSESKRRPAQKPADAQVQESFNKLPPVKKRVVKKLQHEFKCALEEVLEMYLANNMDEAATRAAMGG